MGLKVGIVGLPNVGKSTLFSAITNSTALVANYPFATIDPNIGIVKLPDQRLTQLSSIVNPEKIVPATFEFIDIAGLVKGAAQGEGLGNKFLANIREVDAIIQVIRCFENKDILHVNQHINPLEDIETVNLELILADLETINNGIIRLKKRLINDSKLQTTWDTLVLVKKHLENNVLARNIDLTQAQKDILKQYHLLTLKPVMYVGNIDEKTVSNPHLSPFFQQLKTYAQQQNTPALSICAKIEHDLNELDTEEKNIFLKDLNISHSGLDRLIAESFKLLNLKTFFTAGPKEVKAWIFKHNMSAPECAGIIHSDFERGFIRAEIIKFEDFINYAGYNGTKLNGKIHIEGKKYLMQDGDIVHFRFNV